MKLTHLAFAASVLFGAAGANAAIVATKGTSGGALLTLTSTGALSGSFTSGSTVIATETGGSVLFGSTANVSTRPDGAVGNYLSDSGSGTTTVSFMKGVSYLSFLWGTPDTFNLLTVNDTSYKYSDFGFPGTGTPGTGGYVQFMGNAGSLINTVTFSNSPMQNAFETANFTVTAVPEPETYALMLGGLGLLAAVTRRRRG